MEDSFDSCWKCGTVAEVSTTGTGTAVDDAFYARADAHIDRSNEQVRKEKPGR